MFGPARHDPPDSSIPFLNHGSCGATVRQVFHVYQKLVKGIGVPTVGNPEGACHKVMIEAQNYLSTFRPRVTPPPGI